MLIVIGPEARYDPDTAPFSHAMSMWSDLAMDPETRSSKLRREPLFGSRRFSFRSLTDLARRSSKRIGASVVEMSRLSNSIGERDGSSRTRKWVASMERVSSEVKPAGNVTVR